MRARVPRRSARRLADNTLIIRVLDAKGAPGSGAEHYLVRYPAGLKARLHRHTAAQTIVVVEGRLEVNGEVIGPGAYCHLPAGEAMRHAPADDAPCLFVTVFQGPFDVEPLDG